MKRLKFNTAAISLRPLLLAGFVAGLLAVSIAPHAAKAVLMAIDSTASDPMTSAGLTQSSPDTVTSPDAATETTAQSASVSAPTTLITFSTGSLIIPMDIASSGQDNGMLRAYGLVYQLLRNGVPVSWVINPAKPVNGDDFTISLSNALQDVRTGATISPRAYKGGPFVIAASDTAAALPIIQTWQAAAGDNTAVHRFIGAGSFTVDVARTLVRAPRIAVLEDGNETIAFNNFNAAGIADSIETVWGSASPDVLTETQVEGVTTNNDADGILFHAGSGQPRYCYLASMHYNITSHTNEVVQEVRSWLGTSSSIHAFMQCEAARVFENATGGLFLTNAGLDDDGNATASPLVRLPSNPLTQLAGAFEVDSGAVDSMRANDAPGSTPDYKTGVMTLINESTALLTERIVMLHGRLDGLTTTGQVTYLAGHDYSTVLPVSANPQTNGVRLSLNSIFESDCASEMGQDDVTLTKTAPALTNASEILYTVSYTNPGPGPVENLKLIDELPADTTYVLGSGVPIPTTNSGGVLTWNLPVLASGASATVTFRVTVTVDGTYANAAQMLFSSLTVRSISSNTVTTIRDTAPPSVTIIAGPTGTTTDNTPSFRFTTDATAVTKECRIDNGSFTPCSPDPAEYTSAPLADGPHAFNVRVKDAAGNTGSASRPFTVDTTPAAPTFTSANAATFTVGTAGSFTVTTSGSPSATISESGALPDGVSFIPHADGTGTLSGTPTASGTFPITFTASNGVPPDAMQSFTLTVKQAPAFTSANTATFTVGTAGSFTVTTSGSPSATISESGALPNGVSFSPHADGTGTLSGTPTAGGTFPITFTANNGVPPNAMQSFTLTVTQAPTFTSTSAATFTVGVAGSFTVTTSGFPSATISESGALPNGVSFIPHANGTGTLSGTPTTTGTFPITFTASNGVPPNAMQSFTLTVAAPVLVAIEVTPTNPSVPAGFSQQFTATGTFSDGSSQNLTDSVTWSSDNSAATISNASGSQGLATGVSPGVAQITAQLDAVSGSTTLTVTGAVLEAIEVSPTNPSVSEGHSLQFTATGMFSDGTTRDLTAVATWSSSDHVVASISNADGSEGLATGLHVGTTQISAHSNGVEGSTILTVTSGPLVSISGKVTYCPNSDPVPGVTMSLTGPSPAPSSTPTDGSGNYTLSALTPGGTYTVTPSKAALPSGSAGIDTVDVIAAQRHYLTVGIIPPGCGRDAANVNGDARIDTSDVVAIQRFFLGRPFGFSNVGKYQFTPASRSYPEITSDQTGQDYGALVLGDIVATYVHRSGGHRPDGSSEDATSAGEVAATVAVISLPEVPVAQARSNFIAAVRTTAIDAKNKLVGFQGDFTFDERVVNFQSEPVRKAGITSGNWNVSGNVLDGSGPIRTLRVSAFSNDLTPLAGEGTLFELRMTRMSKGTQRTPLLWAAPPNQFTFIDADLHTQKPANAVPGSVTPSGKPAR